MSTANGPASAGPSGSANSSGTLQPGTFIQQGPPGPPPPAGAPTSSTAANPNANPPGASGTGGGPSLYGFSVHQPYANWPAHSSHSSYATWYPYPAYSQPQTYREQTVQTDAPADKEPQPPKYRKHWDTVFAKFLRDADLVRAQRGFADDMMMMNEDWEKGKITVALEMMVSDLLALVEEAKREDVDILPPKPMDERKLDHIKAPPLCESKTPSTITKDTSEFIARTRRRNDASNRAEFLQSLAEKRQRLDQNGEGSANVARGQGMEVEVPSCARADAKPQNRDVQMKYDIAKNEDGPLKKTMKGLGNSDLSSLDPYASSSTATKGPAGAYEPTADRHPGLTERFQNIESHLAVRYVPSQPHSLLDRMKFLEDHIIKLEREYPPWAALQFNQPNRGWPPPPRTTPIIVPSHLTSTNATDGTTGVRIITPSASYSSDTPEPITSTKKAKSGRGKSSLHRAVMEKLEVQKAIGELTGAAPSASGSGSAAS